MESIIHHTACKPAKPTAFAWLFTLIATVLSHTSVAQTQCPDFLDHEFRRLHSAESVNLCELYNGKPMVIVNTASHCGFTKQFEGLEALHQGYKDQDVAVVGFASDSFKQEAKSEEEAAGVCFENYGVSFTMLAPTPVTGDAANPVFQHLSQHSNEPSWNFNKYLITRDGQVQHFGSRVKPRGDKLEQALKQALGSPEKHLEH